MSAIAARILLVTIFLSLAWLVFDGVVQSSKSGRTGELFGKDDSDEMIERSASPRRFKVALIVRGCGAGLLLALAIWTILVSFKSE